MFDFVVQHVLIVIMFFEKTIIQLQVPEIFKGYTKGNAVKSRNGRAAVSICSDKAKKRYIGNPRNNMDLIAHATVQSISNGKAFKVRCESENLA